MKPLHAVFIVCGLIGRSVTQEDRRPSQCNLPIESEYCNGIIYKYAFDVEKSECIRYIYDGCGGNDNRFDTMSECRKTCETYSRYGGVGRPIKCNQPIIYHNTKCLRDVNNVDVNYSYAFDVSKSECIRFNYLGCAGNANRFDTLSECRKTCEVF